MSRAKPYRSKPTKEFSVLFEVAMSSRYFLVQETGPTKLTLEAANGKKYKIQFGNEVHCSCGGGRTEHCVHTIYAMIKIYKIEDTDPLSWQLAFTDPEIDKILQKREASTLRNRNPNDLWQETGLSTEAQYRNALQQLRQEE